MRWASLVAAVLLGLFAVNAGNWLVSAAMACVMAGQLIAIAQERRKDVDRDRP